MLLVLMLVLLVLLVLLVVLLPMLLLVLRLLVLKPLLQLELHRGQLRGRASLEERHALSELLPARVPAGRRA